MLHQTFNFEVRIVSGDDGDPVAEAGFAECSGMEMTAAPKTIREGGNNGGPIHLAGPISYGFPARITATIGAGSAGIINIEGQSSLSGAIQILSVGEHPYIDYFADRVAVALRGAFAMMGRRVPVVPVTTLGAPVLPVVTGGRGGATTVGCRRTTDGPNWETLLGVLF